jgi:hypothetical protein
MNEEPKSFEERKGHEEKARQDLQRAFENRHADRVVRINRVTRLLKPKSQLGARRNSAARTGTICRTSIPRRPSNTRNIGWRSPATTGRWLKISALRPWWANLFRLAGDRRAASWRPLDRPRPGLRLRPRSGRRPRRLLVQRRGHFGREAVSDAAHQRTPRHVDQGAAEP